MAAVTVGERILVHLSGFLRHLDSFECPPEMTQDGIADALGISRAHVALELKRLRSAGRVEERMAHVANAKVRRKVYALTPSGQEIARRMREHARTRSVTLRSPEGPQTVSGEEAIARLRKSGVREAEAVQRVLVDEVIDTSPPEPPKPSPPPGRPFFGRATELRAAREWLAAEGAPMAVVVGVAGIGKSAFLREAIVGEARPLLLRRLYPHDDAHGLLASQAEFLARQGRRRLKALVSKPAYDPTEALAVWREDLEGVVVALDDLHACPAAESLLRFLLEKPPGCKVLVTSRTVPGFYERPSVLAATVTEIRLDGLDDAAAGQLLASRGASLAPPDVARILEVTHGHPLALELFASSGLEAGEAETGRFILETVLDGLDDASDGVLEAFAVLRRPARSPESLGASVAQLRRLLRKAILQHREDGYFLHDLVREFFVRRMDAGARRRAHARAAEYWEGRDDALEEAYHSIEAGNPDHAVALLEIRGPAYAESARAGDLEACLLRIPEARRPLGLLAEAQTFLGEFTEARDTLDALSRRGSSEERVRARIQLGRIANRQGDYETARTLLTESVARTAELGREDLKGEALRALGGVERKLGELPRAVAHLSEAADLLRDARERSRALTDLGAALIARGDLTSARERLEEALPLARKGSREEAAVENNLAIVLSREGDTRAAARAFERSAELALATGEVRFASYALANAVDNLVRLGALEDAERTADRALDLAETFDDPLVVSTARANLGLVCANRGDWASAERHLMDSVALIARLGNPYSLASRYEEIANLYDAQGRSRDAAPWRERARLLVARMKAPEAPMEVRHASDKMIK